MIDIVTLSVAGSHIVTENDVLSVFVLLQADVLHRHIQEAYLFQGQYVFNNRIGGRSSRHKHL